MIGREDLDLDRKTTQIIPEILFSIPEILFSIQYNAIRFNQVMQAPLRVQAPEPAGRGRGQQLLGSGRYSEDEEAQLKKLCVQRTSTRGVNWNAVLKARTGALAARSKQSLKKKWQEREGRRDYTAEAQKRAPATN